jgi:uncharacterized delta-60 repeat protein
MMARLALALALAAALAPTALAAPADLDPGFGSGGLVFQDFGGIESVPDVVVRPDGKILVAGSAGATLTTLDFAVARFNRDGSLDTSFSPDAPAGLATVDFGGSEGANGIALQRDGKIVVAGTSGSSATADFSVARLTEGGALDTSFNNVLIPNQLNGDGRYTTDIQGQDAALDVLARPNGKTLVIGAAQTSPLGSGDLVAIQLNDTGTPDLGFGNNPGYTRLDLGGQDLGYAAALQPDGKLVFAGRTNVGGGLDYVAARITEGGLPDGSYGDGTGKRLVNFGAFDTPASVLIQRDGKAVLAGIADEVPGNNDFGLARLDAGGSLDPGFGGDGKVAIDFGSTVDGAGQIALTPDGRLAVAGSFTGATSDVAVAVVGLDGAPYGGFSGDGRHVIERAENQSGSGIAVQPDGRFVLSGSNQPGSTLDMLLARLQGLPAPAISVGDAAGGEGGTATFTISLDKASGYPVSVQYATAPGTATAGADFEPRSGTLDFAPGETAKSVPVALMRDLVGERVESFSLNLASPIDATIADGSGAASITIGSGRALRVLSCRTRPRNRLRCRFRNPNQFTVRGSLSMVTAKKHKIAPKKRARRVKMASKRFTVGARKTKAVPIKLSRRGARTLRRNRRLRAALTVTIRDETRTARRARKTLKLKVFKPRRR